MFPQDRVGQNGRIFKALKFRSMVPDADRLAGPRQARQPHPTVSGERLGVAVLVGVSVVIGFTLLVLLVSMLSR